ncbi:MAG: SIMPL domain-containing protein [Alphaproteobacteria bacterium]|nr:MAG: SIMPL domain-containing protein [Alphaproteobacteria bacterium]
MRVSRAEGGLAGQTGAARLMGAGGSNANDPREKGETMRAAIPSAVILAAGIALGGLLVGQSLVESRLGHRTVVVKGFSERVVKADIGFLPVRFNAVAGDLESARALLKRSEEAVFRYFASKGFTAADWEVRNVRVEDRLTSYNASAAPRPNRFVLTEDVVLHSTDVAKIEAAARNMSDLIRDGVVLTSDQYNSGPTFVFTGLNALKPEMLTEATRRARKAAEQFARESGSQVGAIFNANQGLFTIGPAIDIPNERPEMQLEKKVRVVTTITYFLTD